MVALIGAGAFGFVVGWIVYRTLRRREDRAALSDLSAVLAAIGGGAVTQLFPDSKLFGAYGIGLALVFLLYLTVNWLSGGRDEVQEWLGGRH
jgi:hypothetical protein